LTQKPDKPMATMPASSEPMIRAPKHERK
jgi:hypothetical protein